MNLHEYQGKELLASYGIAIQRGFIASNVDEAIAAFKRVNEELGSSMAVVKAQIHAGGRGKGGGVKLVKNLDELKEVAGSIIGMYLKTPQTPGGMEGAGKLVRKVFIAEDSYAPELVLHELIDPMLGLLPFQARKIGFNLGLSGKAFKEFVSFIDKLYKAYVGSDADMFEINPMIKTGDDRIVAVDAKVSIDENSLYRHKDLEESYDKLEEDPTDLEAKEAELNYVKLDGNVGCMVNGAGLAMATMDMIKLIGGSPANFLDVGGTADAKRVESALNLILKDPSVKAILINIFGGIVRCDRVAAGVIEAYKNIGDIPVPIIVRLQGTNAEIAKKMIDESGLKVMSAIELKEAAEQVGKALGI